MSLAATVATAATRRLATGRHSHAIAAATFLTQRAVVAAATTAPRIAATAQLHTRATFTPLTRAPSPFTFQPVRTVAFNAGKKSASEEEQQQQQQSQDAPPEEEASAPSAGQSWAGLAIIVGVIGGVAYLLFRTPAPEEEEPFYTRWPRSFKGLLYGDTPLLPPEAIDANGRQPRTIVLGFDGTLVKTLWSRERSWEIRKRPNVDAFIERARNAGYELILWANHPSYEVEPALQELDPLQYFKYKLYSESTSYKRPGDASKYHADTNLLIRNLARLQRDPKRTIVIDWNPRMWLPAGEGESVMKIAPFDNDINDRELMRVLRILEDIKRYNVHDVQPIIEAYNANPNADLFAKERAAAEEAQAHLTGKNKDRKAKAATAAAARKKEAEEPVEEAKTSASEKQGWGSWLKSKVVGGK